MDRRFTGQDRECSSDVDNAPGLIISEDCMKRASTDRSCCEVTTKLPVVDPPGMDPCFPLAPNRSCLVESFQESGGINAILEDGIQYFATVVERRAATIVRLQSLCCAERDNLHSCFINNQDCSHKCSREVEAFTRCVNVNGPITVDTRIKAHQIDKEKKKRESTLNLKPNILS